MEQNKLIQITTWSLPKEKIVSKYGRISIKEWLLKEKERICKDSQRQAEIRTNKVGYMALFVDDLASRINKKNIIYK